MTIETIRERFVKVTSRLLDADPKVAVVLADISVSRFAAAGTLKRHPHRVVNVGIREQLLISFAAGMALEGFRPIIHTYAPFLVERPFEQVKLDLGHQGLGAVLVSVGASYDASGEGRTHQAPEDVALVATLPDWEIHVPGHPEEVETLLRAAVGGEGCHYIRLAEDANAAPMPVQPGRFVAVRPGSDAAATVIAVGPMLDRVLAATVDLDVTVLYAATVRPFDGGALRTALRSPDVVLIEPYLEGTSAAEVSAALSDTPHRLLSIGVPKLEHRRYGTRQEHNKAHGLDKQGIRARIAAFLRTPVTVSTPSRPA
jgi:transketolase